MLLASVHSLLNNDSVSVTWLSSHIDKLFVFYKDNTLECQEYHAIE